VSTRAPSFSLAESGNASPITAAGDRLLIESKDDEPKKGGTVELPAAPFDSGAGAAEILEPSVRLAILRVEGEMKREIATAIMLLREQIRTVQVGFNEEHVAIEAMRQRFDQQAFLLREDILNARQSAREEAVIMERNVLNQNMSSISDALAVYEASTVSRTNGLQAIVSELQGKVYGLSQKIETSKYRKNFDNVGSAIAQQIARHVAATLRPSNASKHQESTEYFDSRGNIINEAVFVRDLETTLMDCLGDFLPKP
jgi:hypothetical protein